MMMNVIKKLVEPELVEAALSAYLDMLAEPAQDTFDITMADVYSFNAVLAEVCYE